MRAQARECILKKLQMENTIDYEILLTECYCLMKEYNKIHYDVQCNGVNLPACWEALIPLKTEYFRALSHVYYSKNLAKNETFKKEIVDEKHRFKIIKAHLQASQSSHEEILRLQRMCRELRVSFLKTFFCFY
jgi:BRO1-like domain